MSYRIYEYETYSKIVYENELNDCRIILQVYPKNVVLDSYLHSDINQFSRGYKKLKFKVILNLIESGESESGFARKILCDMITKLISSNDFNVTIDDTMILHACGRVNGSDYLTLINMYKRMGFEVIATIRDESFFNCDTYMGTTLKTLLSWCNTRF